MPHKKTQTINNFSTLICLLLCKNMKNRYIYIKSLCVLFHKLFMANPKTVITFNSCMRSTLVPKHFMTSLLESPCLIIDLMYSCILCLL